MNYNKKVPADRYYDQANHIWLKPNIDNTEFEIGLDEVAVKNIGDLVYLSFDNITTSVSKGNIIGKLEASKMIDNLLVPLSGEIISLNENVIKNPSIVNEDPYNNGWLFKIKPSNWQVEKENLINPDNAEEWLIKELNSVQD
ncbi:MAG: glycine cleavage system protein H [Ignavibacteriaceae bacterium]